MELRQIRYFLAVQETGTFTKAAERLFVTQPALSSGIKGLEEELGVKLFERGHKRATLTPEGIRFSARAQAIVGECRAAKEELSPTKRRSALAYRRLAHHSH